MKPATKTCLTCKEAKPHSAFSPRNKKRPDKPKPYCKECSYLKNRVWRKLNPERLASYKRKHVWSLKKRCARRGITLTHFLDVFEQQGCRCAICRKEMPVERTAIDHNHTTGKFRGVLCMKCNRALGMFADSPTVLKSALLYLETVGHYGECSGEDGRT